MLYKNITILASLKLNFFGTCHPYPELDVVTTVVAAVTSVAAGTACCGVTDIAAGTACCGMTDDSILMHLSTDSWTGMTVAVAVAGG